MLETFESYLLELVMAVRINLKKIDANNELFV